MASIDDLPHEPLVHIFSYLGVEELILGASSVCRYWRDAAQDSQLWRHLSYHPNYRTSKSVLLNVLKQAPKLRSFSIDSYYLQLNAAEWESILRVCQDLRVININIEGFSHEEVETIMEQLTSIEDLTIECRDEPFELNLSSIEDLSIECIVRPFELDMKSSSSVYRHCRKLKRLALIGYNVLSTALQGIHNLGELEHLDLGGCTWLTDEAIGYLQDCHKLKYLDIGRSWKVTEEGLRMCFNFPMLEVLKIHDENISTDTLNLIPHHLKNLRKLTIWGDDIGRSDVQQLQIEMPHLQIITG